MTLGSLPGWERLPWARRACQEAVVAPGARAEGSPEGPAVGTLPLVQDPMASSHPLHPTCAASCWGPWQAAGHCARGSRQSLPIRFQSRKNVFPARVLQPRAGCLQSLGTLCMHRAGLQGLIPGSLLPVPLL